ncbi:MAG: hypothetical protein GF330_14735 [Candidatus Eisenbacteria bacterium]|nr:hypothetical protein [Candidatus Eisenbacteria bacterium]
MKASRVRVLSLLVAAGLLLTGGAAMATIHFVAPDGSGDFGTIQEAIWACANGDTVELGDGIFRGNWNRLIDFMGLSITVRSRSGDPQACWIDVDGDPENQRFGFVFHTGETSEARVVGIGVTGGFDLGC